MVRDQVDPGHEGPPNARGGLICSRACFVTASAKPLQPARGRRFDSQLPATGSRTRLKGIARALAKSLTPMARQPYQGSPRPDSGVSLSLEAYWWAALGLNQ